MRVEVWCWPFSVEQLRWCDYPGHAAVAIDGNVYDFSPVGSTPTLQSPSARGEISVRTAEQIANEMGTDFNVPAQMLDGRVTLSRATGTFKAVGTGILPKLHAYPIKCKQREGMAVQKLFLDQLGKPLSYHLMNQNCTHMVRRMLAEGGACTLQGDGWTPDGETPGKWRPDRFDDLLAAQLGNPHHLRLGWRVVERERAAIEPSYVWKRTRSRD